MALQRMLRGAEVAVVVVFDGLNGIAPSESEGRVGLG